MSCEWNRTDCKFIGTEKCDTCFTDGQNYKAAEPRKPSGMARRQAKADNRMGSGFEYRNHRSNQDVLSEKAVTGMTLNSGATVLEKGDEQIKGIIRIMEELKTKVTEQAPGKKSFTIRKEWLDKLHDEARKEDMEFWYLKFCFHEDDRNVYVVTEQDIIMAMVKTMTEDRIRAKKLELELESERLRRKAAESEARSAREQAECFRKSMDAMESIGKAGKEFAA